MISVMEKAAGIFKALTDGTTVQLGGDKYKLVQNDNWYALHAICNDESGWVDMSIELFIYKVSAISDEDWLVMKENFKHKDLK